jgi:hypothetical protein
MPAHDASTSLRGWHCRIGSLLVGWYCPLLVHRERFTTTADGRLLGAKQTLIALVSGDRKLI